MRTTLSIDDDVLIVAKAMARQEERSLGQVISELARRSLQRPAPSAQRNGIPLLRPRAGALPVTLETVNELRDELA
ncbi:CopG family transcriptional regulator [Arboricoccus pini]|nr:CopG family transcriptional regulator [Arboricoccus pini]